MVPKKVEQINDHLLKDTYVMLHPSTVYGRVKIFPDKSWLIFLLTLLQTPEISETIELMSIGTYFRFIGQARKPGRRFGNFVNFMSKPT